MVAYSFKRQFVSPILVGLGVRDHDHLDDPTARPKRQTIRAVGIRRHAHPGSVIKLYCGMRTKACFKIGEARCLSVEKIVIAFGKCPNDTIISIEDAARFTGPSLTQFAQSDGFRDWDEMVGFWEAEHGTDRPFVGRLIKWESL